MRGTLVGNGLLMSLTGSHIIIKQSLFAAKTKCKKETNEETSSNDSAVYQLNIYILYFTDIRSSCVSITSFVTHDVM